MKKRKINLSKIDLTKIDLKKLAIPVAFLVLASLSYYAPERSQQIELTSSYPATVCPAIGNKISSIAALTSTKINRRSIDGSSKRLNPGKSSVIPMKNDAILLKETLEHR